MRLTRTIAFRLFLLIVTVQTIILGVLTYLSVTVQQAEMRDHVVLSAVRLSDMIGRSTRYSMLLNRKEDVHEIVAAVGGEPGIEGIRIYNKSGEVIFGTSRADLKTRVDMNAEACVTCHAGSGLQNPHPPGEQRYRIFSRPDGERVLGLITPIRNEPQCSDADCHAHPASKTVLGVLDVKMSLASVDQRIDETRNQLLVYSLGAVLLVGLISGGFIWFFVRRPVKRLIAGMEMVSAGNLDHRLESRTTDELGRMASTFNAMTEDLSKARHEITSWSETLEQKVKEKTADLETAHKQMVRVEKMASLGNLASSVAHELNNPLEGILTFAKLLIKRIKKSALPPEQIQPYCEDLTLVAEEAQRCGNIVKNLLIFARQGTLSFQQAHMKLILDRCVLLVNHFAQMKNVEVRLRCAEEDLVECDPNQIQQVLIALMMNAIEAMTGTSEKAEGGTLALEGVRTAKGDNFIIKVSDTGSGMSEDTKAHIFEPFFTTKSEGKGVGLGLAIAYGIIQRHRGGIDVESAVGRGTTFTLTLPVTQPGIVNAPSGNSTKLEGNTHEQK